MAHTNGILTQIANEVVNKEKIISYLDVIKNNINMSAINCSMIYLQNPTAKMVCGKKAWEEMNRTVKEGTIPLVLFFPSITIKEPPEEFCIDGKPQAVGDTDVPIYLKEATYNSDYIPVNAFGLDDTIGDDFSLQIDRPAFIDEVIEVSGAIPDIVHPDTLDGYKGKYSPEENILYISDAIDTSTDYGRDEYDKTIIDLFIDYKMYWYHLEGAEIKKAVEYILFERYGFKHNIETPLFVRLNKYTNQQKVDFLLTVHYLVSDIVQDFEGYYLSFDETALVNDLLISSDCADMWIAFDKAIISINDEILTDGMQILKDKLMRSADGYLEDLLALKIDHKLYSYPPKEVLLDNVDYLRKERRELLSAVVAENPE